MIGEIGWLSVLTPAAIAVVWAAYSVPLLFAAGVVLAGCVVVVVRRRRSSQSAHSEAVEEVHKRYFDGELSDAELEAALEEPVSEAMEQ